MRYVESEAQEGASAVHEAPAEPNRRRIANRISVTRRQGREGALDGQAEGAASQLESLAPREGASRGAACT